MPSQPRIQDLAVVSDRRTCALLDQQGTLCWYCPGRFDSAAVLALLLDAEQGGYWAVEAPGKEFVRRAYLGRSSVLVSEFAVAGQPFTLTALFRRPLLTSPIPYACGPSTAFKPP